MNKGVFVDVIVSKVGKDKDVMVDLVNVEPLIYNLEGLLRTLEVPFREVRFSEIARSWESGIEVPCYSRFQGAPLGP